MKTKHIFGLVAVVAVTGFAASAQAGWSLNFSFAAPVLFPAPLVVTAPRCLPPFVYCPSPVVYAPSPCRPVVYVAPRCAPNYGYRAYPGPGRSHVQAGWSQNAWGYSRGGHR
jgi:hypothetical protein